MEETEGLTFLFLICSKNFHGMVLKISLRPFCFFLHEYLWAHPEWGQLQCFLLVVGGGARHILSHWFSLLSLPGQHNNHTLDNWDLRKYNWIMLVYWFFFSFETIATKIPRQIIHAEKHTQNIWISVALSYTMCRVHTHPVLRKWFFFCDIQKYLHLGPMFRIIVKSCAHD